MDLGHFLNPHIDNSHDAKRERYRRFNLLYGVSRKSFIGRLLGIEQPKLRDAPSKTLEISLAMMGTKIIRTHDAHGLLKIRDALC